MKAELTPASLIVYEIALVEQLRRIDAALVAVKSLKEYLWSKGYGTVLDPLGTGQSQDHATAK